MGDSKDRMALLDEASKSGAKKLGEKAVDRALNALADFIKKKYGESQVKLGTVFERYLENAMLRYNQVRTLATGQVPRKIVGEDSIYINVGLRYGEEEVSTATVEPILRISENVLISGTGGIGKSMLMRYLFLNTAHRGEYVPVLVELRRINNQPSEKRSILELVFAAMQGLNAQLPREQFEYSLELGKYLFLFDGLDEVKTSLTVETAEALQAFSAKYPYNPCIITSRPMEELSPLETFVVMEPMPLSKEQAVQLAERIRTKDEKTQEFCEQLENTLYDKHRDFAENPLLLSMMFLTFMRNMSIPEHLSDFYQKAYDALYSIHDSNDKGSFRRDFHCKNLDEDGFKRLFSHFCFQTYMKEIYEFSKADILSRLNTSIQKLGISDIQAEAYLKDLRDAVCMIIRDGDTYRFSHRSFQAYFSAYYTSTFLTDEQQKHLFKSVLSRNFYWNKQDYYELLYQIESKRFAINALEEELRKIRTEAKEMTKPEMIILRSVCSGFGIGEMNKAAEDAIGKLLFYVAPFDKYRFNVVQLFDIIVCDNHNGVLRDKDLVYTIENILQQSFSAKTYQGNRALSFSQIDAAHQMPETEREALYSALIEYTGAYKIYSSILSWLDEVDRHRASLQTPDFIDDL